MTRIIVYSVVFTLAMWLGHANADACPKRPCSMAPPVVVVKPCPAAKLPAPSPETSFVAIDTYASENRTTMWVDQVHRRWVLQPGPNFSVAVPLHRPFRALLTRAPDGLYLEYMGAMYKWTRPGGGK